MIFWLANTIGVAIVLMTVTYKFPSSIKSRFTYQFSLGVASWIIGYVLLSFYPVSWLSESDTIKDDYSVEIK